MGYDPDTDQDLTGGKLPPPAIEILPTEVVMLSIPVKTLNLLPMQDPGPNQEAGKTIKIILRANPTKAAQVLGHQHH